MSAVRKPILSFFLPTLSPGVSFSTTNAQIPAAPSCGSRVA
jgi:hypothetical protein